VTSCKFLRIELDLRTPNVFFFGFLRLLVNPIESVECDLQKQTQSPECFQEHGPIIFLQVEVVDVNENIYQPQFAELVYSGSIRENRPAGSKVMQVSLDSWGNQADWITHDMWLIACRSLTALKKCGQNLFGTLSVFAKWFWRIFCCWKRYDDFPVSFRWERVTATQRPLTPVSHTPWGKVQGSATSQ